MKYYYKFEGLFFFLTEKKNYYDVTRSNLLSQLSTKAKERKTFVESNVLFYESVLCFDREEILVTYIFDTKIRE